MTRGGRGWLVMRAWWELLRHDLIHAGLGFRYVCRQVERQRVLPRPHQPGLETRVCEAVTLAACFYWKPVHCLQRSAAATRLLRKSGIHGRLVIGYRPSPFVSHAWVEVGGRVVNDSQAYKERMYVLCSF